jgi:hypothetical protein
MNKKGAELSLTVIIVAIILIVVLVVVIIIFGSKLNVFGRTSSNCIVQGGSCKVPDTNTKACAQGETQLFDVKCGDEEDASITQDQKRICCIKVLK